MKNPIRVLMTVLMVLAGYAILASNDALRRGERMTAIVMLFIAVIFINKVQTRS